MIQEHKDILLKDLCARLPYYVKAEYHTTEGTEIGIIDGIYRHDLSVVINDNEISIFDIKPYLFPMSSMTMEQQSYVYFNTKFDIDRFGTITPKIDEDDQPMYVDEDDWLKLFDWLNTNHFDYRGLIDRGLAIDATNKDIYF